MCVLSHRKKVHVRYLISWWVLVLFIEGILVCTRRPKDGIALGLFQYRDDNGSKTALWVGFSVLDLSFVQYWSESCSLRSSSGGSWANTCRLLTGEVQ